MRQYMTMVEHLTETGEPMRLDEFSFRNMFRGQAKAPENPAWPRLAPQRSADPLWYGDEPSSFGRKPATAAPTTEPSATPSITTPFNMLDAIKKQSASEYDWLVGQIKHSYQRLAPHGAAHDDDD